MTSWLWRAPLPSEMRVAVLPISVAGVGEQDTTCCAGLLEYVAVRLADLSRFQGRVSVVPTSELLSAGVNSPSAAGRALAATIAVSISVHRAGDSLLVSVSLADAEKVRQLTGKSKTFRLSSFSPEDVVNLVFPLLELELAAGDKTAWNLGSSGVAEAGVLYAQGLSQTPYQQAQSRLEQYDQERSLEQAIKLFNEAVNLDSRYAAAHAALAEARVRLYRLTRNPEDLALAEQSVKQALALDATRPGAWMTLGMILVQRGDIAQAEKAFSEAIARNPNGADTYRELGLAYQRGRLWDKAETAYRKAIRCSRSRGPTTTISALSSTTGSGIRRPRRNSAERSSSPPRTPACGRTWAVSTWPGAVERRRGGADDCAPELSPRPGALEPGLPQDRSASTRRQPAILEQAIEGHAARPAHLAQPRRGQLPGRTARARGGGLPAGRPSLRGGARHRSDRCRGPFGLADCYAMLGDGERARPLVAEALRRGIAPDDYPGVVGVFEEIGDREEAIRQLGRPSGRREPGGARAGPDVRRPEEGPALRRAREGGGGEGQEGSLNAATQNRRSEWLASTMSTFSRWTGNTEPGRRSPPSSAGTGSRSAISRPTGSSSTFRRVC